MKRALISGVTGQDGSYLADMLLEKGYEVQGIVRRVSTPTTERVEHLRDNPNFSFVEGDITDASSMSGIVSAAQADEFYHMAAMSHVGVSFKQPFSTMNINAMGTANILEAIRTTSPNTKLIHAATSEMYGNSYTVRQYAHNIGDHGEDNYYVKNIQDENTLFTPRSPYGAAKLAAFHLCKVYRESYGLFVCSSICFNHESPRRGLDFVSRKITNWIAKFYKWQQNRVILKKDDDNIYGVTRSNALDAGGRDKWKKAHGELVELDSFPKLRLGNLDSKRDWGYAGDYVLGMWMMLQTEKPKDYVLATGETHSIRDFLDEAFKQINVKDWSDYIVIDPQFYRPNEVDYLLGDASKIKKELGWEPQVTFKELVQLMVEADIRAQA